MAARLVPSGGKWLRCLLGLALAGAAVWSVSAAGAMGGSGAAALTASWAGTGLVALLWALDRRRRGRVERRLRDGAARWRSYIEAAPDAVFVFDTRGRILDANPAACRLTDRTRQELLAQSLPDLCRPDESGECRARLARLGREGHLACELSCARRDGSSLTLALNAARLDEERFLACGADISEHRQADDALRLLEFSVDRAGESAFWIDGAARIRHVNESACAALGYRRSDLLGASIAQIEPSFPTPSWPTLWEQMRGRPARTVETLHRRHDGTYFPVELRMSLVEFGGRELACVFARDITERQEGRAALLRALDEAERAGLAKSEFLARMSHEIRTPLHGVIGMADVLSGTPLAPEQLECVRTIQNSANVVLAMMNEILDVSRIEAGAMTLESISFDLRETVEDVADVVSVRAREKGLDLAVRWAAGAPRWLVGDPVRVRQVLLNLVANAVKFTESGHVLISVEGETGGDGRARLRIGVADTGIGIAPDKHRIIFEKFTQVDSTIARRYGGSGLGLAICRQLVELMGGRISLDSAPGAGTTFRIELALVADPQGGPAAADAPLSGTRVLVADPGEITRRALAETLVELGARCETATGASAAAGMLARARDRGDPYDCVATDVSLLGAPDGLADGDLGESRLLLLAWPGAPEPARAAMVGERAGRGATRLTKPVRGDALLTAVGGRAAVAPARTEDIDAGPLPPLAEGRRPRVLVAEDNTFNQKVALRALERLGCLPDVAAHGAEAMMLARKRRYDLILMDCEMPLVDGFLATARIRDAENAAAAASGLPPSRVPIVAMTAHAMPGHRERCIAAGMDDHVGKPLRPGELRATLERWLYGSPAAGRPEMDPATVTPS